MSNSARTPTISQFQKPPPVAVPFMALVFFLGAPLLQTFALLHLAVTIGRNILLFYQEYVDASSEENKSSGRSGALVSSAEGEGTASDGRGAAEGGAAAVAAMAVEGGVAVALGATAIRKPEGEGEEGAGVFLYEQQGVLPSSPPVVAADIPTLSPTPPPPAPLQPSAGGQLGKAGRALGRQRMQALSTIYEVAFKGRGAAAASLRPGSGGEGVGSGPSSAPSDSSDQQQGGDLEQQGAGTNSEPSSSEGERTLRRNSLVKEMLGVGVRRPFTQLLGSGSGSGSGGADGGGSGGGSDKQPSELEWDGNMTPAMPGGGERRSYGWQVESEVSSLTDFQDDYYQTGSLSLNPSPVRLARPGPSSLNPSPAAPMRPAAAARPSSLNPSPVRPSRTVFSPARFLRRSDASSRAVPAVPPATMPPGTAASASVLAPATRDSDAGRSIVTESEWREWQKRKDGNDDDN